jgi:hypothetical protein
LKEIDDLRATVLAFLEIDRRGPHDVAKTGYERVRAALDAAHAAKPTLAEATVLWDEIEKAARERSMIYLSPLYPWGVVSWVKGLVEAARHAAVAHEDMGPCNCAFVLEHGFLGRLRSDHFVQIGESNDFYDRYKEFRCPHCTAIWRYADSSTEQVTDWAWVPVTSTESSP